MKTKERNHNRYLYKGQRYSAGKLILTVIKDYMNKNPKTTLDELKEIFPRELQTRFDVVAPVSRAKKISQRIKRYYLKADQIISTKEGKKVAITNYWGSTNDQKIINYFRKELRLPIRLAA